MIKLRLAKLHTRGYLNNIYYQTLCSSALKNILGLINSEELLIDPFDATSFKPASYTFKVGARYFDENSETQAISSKGLVIEPNEFLIIESLETITFPNHIGGILSTRGSIAKLGLDCLLTDTIIEPGSTGKLTFCIKNNSSLPRTLHTNDSVVKCLFFEIK